MGASVEQDAALIQELETAVRLLQIGCRQAHDIDGANDFYHLPMLTLASGFERLMKVVICLHAHEATGDYPDGNPWPPKRGHDLLLLLDRVVELGFANGYAARVPAGRADLDYLRSTRLREVVGLLSDFGQAARYYNLDLILGRNPKGDAPDDVWAAWEMAIVQEDPEWAAQVEQDLDLSQTYTLVNQRIVSELERLARAIARLFTIGGLGSKALQVSSAVFPFLMLRDEELGIPRSPAT